LDAYATNIQGTYIRAAIQQVRSAPAKRSATEKWCILNLLVARYRSIAPHLLTGSLPFRSVLFVLGYRAVCSSTTALNIRSEFQLA
jgi:hypothetical protein